MAQPTPYTRQFDFSDFQTVNPARPLPGSELDAELDRVKLTSDQTLANLAKIQRDDGRLNNQAVTPESLSAATLALIAQGEYNPRGFWAAATAFQVGDLVEFNAATFLALVAHTSDTQFTTDQTAGRWLLIANGALSGQAAALDLFEGTGSQTVFTVSFNYTGNNAATVFVGGVAQIPGQDFTIVGDTLTFVSAPPAPAVPGRKNVMVRGTGVEAQLASDAATVQAANAANSATAAQNSATAASNSAGAALASENAASASQAAAATSATNASNSASAALSSQNAAASSASAASTSATNAASSASAASTSATNAATSATTATNQATTATQQATAASNSASAAATSATNASNSASNASGSASTATTQASNAAASATAAGSSATNAANSASQASTSASNASASASSASSSASSANTSAVNAASSATNAGNSATAAGNSAAAALASQNAAATSESNAATSASAAAASYDEFDDRYLGAKTSDPTVDNDGNTLLVGAIYFNSVAAEMRVWNGTNWQPQAASPDTLTERNFVATAGQTSYTVTGGYRVGYTFVWVNGVLLSDADITATNGTDITFTTPLALNDEVRILSFKAVGTVAVSDISGLQAALDGKLNAANPSYTGTLTGGTGVINIGSGQLYKDVSGNVGIGPEVGTTSSANQRLLVTASNEGAITYGLYIHNDSFSAGSARISLSPRFSFAYNTAPYVQSVSESTSAAALTFGTTASNVANERMRITSAGNVGIGTSSPANRLDIIEASGGSISTVRVNNGFTGGSDGSQLLLGNSIDFTNAYFRLNGGGNSSQAGAGSLNIGLRGSAPVAFYTADTERARITSGGNFGVGTSSPGEGRVHFNVVNAGAGDISSVALNLTNNSTSAGTGVSLRFSPGNIATVLRGSYINSVISGANGSDLQFWTCVSGFAPAERMRIDPNGNLLVGQTASSGSGKQEISFAVSSQIGFRFNMTDTTYNNAVMEFRTNTTTRVGFIFANGSSTTYSTTSDYRLKHDIQPMTGALAKVQQLKPVTYKWNADDSQSQGFIAHELQEVVPECVTGEKDAVDKDGKPVYQGIDTSFLVATLTAALQEAVAEINSLKARLDAANL